MSLKLNNFSKRRYLLSAFVFIFTLIFWEALSRSKLYPIHLFPPPTQVFPVMKEMLKTGELWINLKSSGMRWLSGYVLGAFFGVALGLFTGQVSHLRYSLGSLFNALSSIPKIVLIPIAILWFGLGETQKILLVAWGTFFPVWLNTQTGSENIETEYLWTADSLGLRGFAFFRHVIFPNALPNIITGMRIGISTATFSLAAAEMSGAFTGLAHQVFYSHEMFQTDRMMAGIVYITLFSFLINEIFIFFSKIMLPWALINRGAMNNE